VFSVLIFILANMRNNVARKNIEELREEIERREFHNSQIILSEITSQVKKISLMTRIVNIIVKRLI